MSVIVYIESEENKIKKASLEAVSYAKNIPIFEVPYFKTMSTESIDFWLDTDNIKNIFLR